MAKKSFSPGDMVKVAALADAPEMVGAGSGMLGHVKCPWFTARGRIQEHMIADMLLILVRRAVDWFVFDCDRTSNESIARALRCS
jgi:uncharacterized protein YodC (DUF2158 family)